MTCIVDQNDHKVATRQLQADLNLDTKQRCHGVGLVFRERPISQGPWAWLYIQFVDIAEQAWIHNVSLDEIALVVDQFEA